MRPTDLKFRSPKEVTPDFYDIVKTRKGDSCLVNRVSRGVPFGSDHRFKSIRVSSSGIRFTLCSGRKRNAASYRSRSLSRLEEF